MNMYVLLNIHNKLTIKDPWVLFTKGIKIKLSQNQLKLSINGQMLFCNGKLCKHVETPKEYPRQLFYIPVPYIHPFQILK